MNPSDDSDEKSRGQTSVEDSTEWGKCSEIEIVSSNTDDRSRSEGKEIGFPIEIMRIKGIANEIQRVNAYESLEGVTAKTCLELENLYRRHSQVIGFGIRKWTTRRNKADELIARYYVCVCEGVTRSKAVTPVVQKNNRKRKEFFVTRTDCKARIFVKLNKDGMFQVEQHITVHNHDLTRTAWQHLHRSERTIEPEEMETIESMEESGLKPADGYRYIVNSVGGEAEAGHTMKDHLNAVNRLRMQQIEGGDAQKLVDILTELEETEVGFFFRVLLDRQGKLSGVFWRDSMMAEDFRIYGDLLVFDTTYRTNKYNLVCAPFVGLNNHRQNVMFGCAFLSDETVGTFVWVLQMFKKSMGGIEPVTIFTDQDVAMTRAILEVYPNTKHRLCLWHLKQNAMSHYGNMRSDSDFIQAFNKCLMFCTDEDEFEREWADMINKYGLQEHPWFARLYTLRDKWCTALSKDFFSARTLSSQRSESTNAAISFNASKTTTLVRFYKIFGRTVHNWRTSEIDREFYCSRAKLRDELEGPSLLRHAAKIYTHTIFKEVRNEWNKGMSSNAYLGRDGGNMCLYEVIHDKSISRSAETVMYTKPTKEKQAEVTCSCRYFEEVWLLCCHCLRVLHLNNQSHIPDQYISSRWSKMAKMEVWNRSNAADDPSKMLEPQLRDKIPWRLRMTRKFYNLVIKSEGNLEARKVLEESFQKDTESITALTSNMQQLDIAESSTTTQQTKRQAPAVLNPEYVKTKGRSKRVKSGIERAKPTSNEFGSKTPNPHLF